MLVSTYLLSSFDSCCVNAAMFGMMQQSGEDGMLPKVRIMDGIYHCVTKEGKKVLCHVQRKAWMSSDGYQGAYFLAISVLPKSKYCVTEPVSATRKKKKAKLAPPTESASQSASNPAKSASSTMDALANTSAPVPAPVAMPVAQAVPIVDVAVPILGAGPEADENLEELIFSLLDDPIFFG